MSRLHDLGEKAFIREVLGKYALTARAAHVDDCIVIDPVETLGIEGPYLVYSLDHPSRIRRRLPAGMEWRFFGRWAAALTCGDVLAMGARPRGFSLDLALPLEIDVNVITEIYAGLMDVLGTYGAALEGGNLDINGALEIVGFCWGTCDRGSLIRRSGARRGDHVAITSDLGIGWSSFVLQSQGSWDRLTAAEQESFLTYNLMPLAPHRAILAAADLGGAITSGMDLTDGPIEFLYTIRERMGLGVRIEESELPESALVRRASELLDVPASALMFDPGYDTPRAHGYTVAPERWHEVIDAFAANGATIHRIGSVTDEPTVRLVRKDGSSTELPAFWDDQFRKRDVFERWLAAVDQIHPGQSALRRLRT